MRTLLYGGDVRISIYTAGVLLYSNSFLHRAIKSKINLLITEGRHKHDLMTLWELLGPAALLNSKIPFGSEGFAKYTGFTRGLIDLPFIKDPTNHMEFRETFSLEASLDGLLCHVDINLELYLISWDRLKRQADRDICPIPPKVRVIF